MQYPEFDLEKLKKEQEEYSNNKGLLDLAGTIGQDFANQPTAYEVLYNKKLGGNNVKGVTDAVSKNMVDPMAKSKMDMETFNNYRAIEDAKKKDVLQAEQRDPLSKRSVGAKAAYNQFSKYGVQIDPNDTEETLIQRYGPISELMNNKIRNLGDIEKIRIQKGLDAQEKEKDRQNQAYLKSLDDQKKSDPKNLTGSDKARYDNSLMVLKAIDGMDGALAGGQNTMTFKGDNDFTLNARNAAEAIGRMQSGGAIGVEEEKRFRAMLPTIWDSQEMQAKKLANLREEMTSRLSTLGVPMERTGYTPSELTYGSKKTNTANAAPKSGDIKEWNGKVYQVVNGQWVELKEKARP